MENRMQNAKVSPLLKKKKKKKGKRKQDSRFELSPALFNVTERRPKAKYRQIRKCSNDDTSVDRISMLPDALLSFILSRITVKEQIATSILSHRWRYLWTLATRLDFDGIDSLERHGLKEEDDGMLSALEKVKLDYVNWVNHVLASREGSTIQDFKVYSDLGKEYEGYIDEWIRYALAWKVQTLELNLHATLLDTKYPCYVFPDRLFSSIDEGVGSNQIHFKQLKKLSMNYVDVDGNALEFFLHNCPLLEYLSVSKSSKLLSLSVTGPFPSLRYLEITRCYKLRSLEICDVNLVCFKYDGMEISFFLRNLPMLAHISVSKSMLEYMKGNIPQFSSILQQLEIFNVPLQSKTFLLPVEMSNLKQLEVVVPPYLVEHDQSLLWLTDIIHSAPRLQKFVVESQRLGPRFPKRELRRMKIEKSYPHLKEVEFVGFCAVPSDLEFVFHFVDNAVALEKILIDTKKTHETLWCRKFCNSHYNIYKDVRDQVEKKIALEKPWIKVEFLITPY